METEKGNIRISRISEIIDIKRLESESRKYLYLGFFVAIIFHAVIGVFITYKRTEIQVAEPKIIKLRFIEPQMTEPFTITKRTFRKKSLQRRSYRFRTPAGTIETTILPEYTPEYELPPVDIEVESSEDVIMPDGVDIDLGTIPPKGAKQQYGAVPYKTQNYLEGLWLDDRLIAVYSDRGYGLMWEAEPRNREHRKMGVNFVFFALLQQKGYHRGKWYIYR